MLTFFYFTKNFSDDIVRSIGTIGPKGTMKYPLEVTGVKLGSYTIVAGLCCDQVELVSGEHEVGTGWI